MNGLGGKHPLTLDAPHNFPSSRILRTLLSTAAVALLVVLPSHVDARQEQVKPVGDRSARPQPFDLPGHEHHPANSIIGNETPHLVPTDVAVSLLLRTLGDADRRDRSDPLNRVGKFIRHIEKASGHAFSAPERRLIVEAARSIAATDKPNGFAHRAVAQTTWSSLLAAVSPPSRASLGTFVELNVKHHTKILR